MERSEEIKIQLNGYIMSALVQQEFKQNIKLLFRTEFKNTLNSLQRQLSKNDAYKNLKLSFKIYIIKTVKSENFKTEIRRLVETNLKAVENSNRTLDSIIPPAVLNGFKVYIYNHKDEIISSIKKLVNSKNIESKISEQISFALNGLNPMMARFINTDSIQDKILISLNEYLDNPKNIVEVINIINGQLDSFTKKKISDFLNNFPSEGKKSIIDSLVSSVVNMLSSEKLSDKVISFLEDKMLDCLSSLNDHPEKISSEIESFINNFIDSYYDKLIGSQKTKELVSLLSDNIVDNILKKPVIDLI